MKAVKIHARAILERTGYKAHPYKNRMQYIVMHDGKAHRNGHLENLGDKRLRKPFAGILSTRSRAVLEEIIETLGRTDDEKWLKATLKTILEENE